MFYWYKHWDLNKKILASIIEDCLFQSQIQHVIFMKGISKITCLFKKITTNRDVPVFKRMQIFTLKIK